MQKILCNVNTFHLHLTWLCSALYSLFLYTLGLPSLNSISSKQFFLLLCCAEECMLQSKLISFETQKKIQGICASSVHNSCFCLPHFWDPENEWYRKAYIDLDILRMDMYLARVCRLCVEMSISYAFVLHWLHLWFPPFLASWIREIWFVNVSFFHFFQEILTINSVADTWCTFLPVIDIGTFFSNCHNPIRTANAHFAPNFQIDMAHILAMSKPY